LANENISRICVNILRESGLDVLYIGDDFASIQDVDVVKIANQEERLIITRDRDYGELIFRNNLIIEGGVLYVRTLPIQKGEIANITLRLIQDGYHFRRSLVVVSENGIRQKFY